MGGVVSRIVEVEHRDAIGRGCRARGQRSARWCGAVGALSEQGSRTRNVHDEHEQQRALHLATEPSTSRINRGEDRSGSRNT